MTTKRILVTGATGKVGQHFINRLLNDPEFNEFTVRGLCHNRMLDPADRLEVVKGNMQYQEDVDAAMQDVTHVLHLATVKETPELIMDVAVKGMFWLLEACRTSPTFEQFILVGGDAALGHFIYPHPIPVTEMQEHTAYAGCYALSKVLEEVMLEQYYVQYDFNGCCLRAPWIMEKDDFKYQVSFGDDIFGGVRWRDAVGAKEADAYIAQNAVPVPLAADGKPLKRNFVHVDDLASAILAAIDAPKTNQQTFNICMNEPVDYGDMGAYLEEHYSMPGVPIPTEFHSTWLDNAKARFLLGWNPVYDLPKMIDAAWTYERAADDPRKIWYPG